MSDIMPIGKGRIPAQQQRKPDERTPRRGRHALGQSPVEDKRPVRGREAWEKTFKARTQHPERWEMYSVAWRHWPEVRAAAGWNAKPPEGAAPRSIGAYHQRDRMRRYMLLYLLNRMNGDGIASLKMETIAADTGIEWRHAQKVLDDLDRALIDIVRYREGKRNFNNSYDLNRYIRTARKIWDKGKKKKKRKHEDDAPWD